MNRTQELTKKTFIISLGKISTQLVTFFLLPLYTALLTTNEYGIVDLVTTLVQLFIPVVSLMIDQAVFRFLLNCKSDLEYKKTISSAFGVLTLSNIITIIVYLLLSFFITNSIKIWVLLILIATSYSNFFLQISRGLKNTKKYAIGSFICSCITLILNVLCITALKMGALGMVFAIFIGNVVCCFYLFFSLNIYKYISMKFFDKEEAINQVKYSVPLIPNQLSLWIMNSSDRLITVLILGLSLNGILAVSHKFPAIFMTVFGIFQLAWHETGAVHYNDKDRDDFFSQTFDTVITLFSTICIGIIVCLPLVFDLLVKSSFSYAYYNIPIYMVAFLFNVVIGLLGVIYVATKKTVEIAKTTALAAIINIAVNLLLIKKVGLYAASISTFVGYLVAMIFRLIDSKKYINIKFNYKKILFFLLMTGFYTYLYYLKNFYISIAGLIVFLPLSIVLNIKLIKEILFGMKINKYIASHKKQIVTIFILLLSLLVLLFYYKRDDRIDIMKSYSGKIIELVPYKTIYFEDLNLTNFTCTGFAYDEERESFWIADFGSLSQNEERKPRLIEINIDFNNVKNIFYLDSIIDNDSNLQGITINSKNNTIYIATGKMIYIINKQGEFVNKFNLADYKPLLSNGLAYSYKDDSLFVLMNKKYLMKYDSNWNLINKYSVNYKDQDHIFIDSNSLYISIGADYSGIDNYVLKTKLDSIEELILYRVIDSYAVEGISIVNNNLYVVNDGYYHSAKIDKSYINIYKLS